MSLWKPRGLRVPILFLALLLLPPGIAVSTGQTDGHPLGERDSSSVDSIDGLRVLSQVPGVYNRPGTLTLGFRVLDAEGHFFPAVTARDLRVWCGGRKITGFIFNPRPQSYAVAIPRLPYQEKNGAYDLRVSVEKDGSRAQSVLTASALYQSARLNLVLLIDTSTSMRINDPSNFRIEAVNRIVRYGRLLNIIDKISVVKFSSSARVLCPLTSVRNVSVLAAASAGIDSDGETNIADGLDKALEEALKAGKKERTIVILVTDGENNFPYADQHRKFAAHGIPVFTIGLTRNVNNAFLDRIASSTGGEYYQIPDSFSILSVYNRIVQDEFGNRILVDEEVTLRPGQRTNFSLDPGLRTKKVNFLASWEKKKPKISVTGPSAMANVTVLTGFQTFEVPSPGHANGLSVANTSKFTNRFSLIGFVNSSLILKCGLSRRTWALDEPVEFSLTAWQDDRPLSRCSAYVSVRSAVTNITLRLRDDGLHNDGIDGDGLYRNYLCGLAPGEYKCVFTVKGSDLFDSGFKRTVTSTFTVLTRPVEGPRIDSGTVNLTRAGAGIGYFQSFRAISREPESVSLRIFCLPFPTMAGSNAITIGVNPSHLVLDQDRSKLFNITVRAPADLASGIYSTRLIMVETDRFHSIPLDVDFYKYFLPEAPEKAK